MVHFIINNVSCIFNNNNNINYIFTLLYKLSDEILIKYVVSLINVSH